MRRYNHKIYVPKTRHLNDQMYVVYIYIFIYLFIYLFIYIYIYIYKYPT
jgi:hypothetical protein